MLASCDVVVHCAATVAFDAPLDTAVEVNLLGPSRVASAIEAAATLRAVRRPGAPRTHLVTVSTAYVAGTHQGVATETLSTEAMRSGARARTHTTVTTEVDIDAEVAAARRVRADLEAESRRPQSPERSSPRRHAPISARRAPTSWPNEPRNDATSGCANNWWKRAGPGAKRWDGPTPTPSPRHSANGHW